MNRFIKAMALLFTILSVPLGLLAAESGNSPNDQNIAFWITDALYGDSRIDASRIQVVVLDGGIATLSGTVPDLSSKEYAALEAEKIRGVKGVVNEISVKVISRPDTEIKRDLFRAFMKDPIIDVFSVNAEVEEGNVTLTGQVYSWSQRSEAGMLASEVRGVKSVHNRIEVVYESPRPDEEIRRDIIASFHRDVYLTHQPITVSVKSGVVTLDGRTATLYEKERAVDRARRVDNVKSIVDRIHLAASENFWVRAGAPAPTNENLEKDVRDELWQDPRVKDPFEIIVTAVDGRVTLQGEVPSAYQKRLSARDSYNVIGVTLVRNLLSVKTPARDDTSIREDVRFDLASESLLNGLNIAVRVTDGVVSLSGEVNTLFRKEHAADVASRTPGVRDVINGIEVNRIPSLKEEALKDLIKARLTTNGETHEAADRIDILVVGGMVTLSGEVNTWSEYREAAEIASYTNGVSGVVNRLRVVSR